jgi:hypothetical protein
MANPTTKCLHSRLPQGWHVLRGFQRPGRCNIVGPGVASIHIQYLQTFHRRRHLNDLPYRMQRPPMVIVKLPKSLLARFHVL